MMFVTVVVALLLLELAELLDALLVAPTESKDCCHDRRMANVGDVDVAIWTPPGTEVAMRRRGPGAVATLAVGPLVACYLRREELFVLLVLLNFITLASPPGPEGDMLPLLSAPEPDDLLDDEEECGDVGATTATPSFSVYAYKLVSRPRPAGPGLLGVGPSGSSDPIVVDILSNTVIVSD